MPAESNISWPLKVLVKSLLNIAVVWLMAKYLSQYFHVTGGIPAYIIIGALLTLMNMFVRPILDILTLPLKLFATIIAIIIVNGAFIQLVHTIAANMNPNLVTLNIYGGLWGWVVVAVVLGFSNWLIKIILHR